MKLRRKWMIALCGKLRINGKRFYSVFYNRNGTGDVCHITFYYWCLDDRSILLTGKGEQHG